MAIARLTGQDSKGISTTTSVSATYTGATTTGNTLIATMHGNVTTGLATITGWSLIVEGAFSGTAQFVSIWAKIADGTETTVTASGATGATIMKLHLYEYSGLTAALTTDGTNSATSGVTSVSSLLSGSVTTVNANDLLIVATASGGSSTAHGYDSSFSLRQTDATAIRLFDADQIVSATGTYSTTASWTTALRGGSVIAAFKAASSTPTLTGISSITGLSTITL